MHLSIEGGFDDRRVTADPAIIERVMKAYQRSKEVQQGAAEVYQVSHMWLPIYSGYMGEVMDVMARRDAEALGRIYANFFRESCSVGIHGLPIDMAANFFNVPVISDESKGKYVEDIMHRFNIWLSSMGKALPLDVLETPVVGNPYGFYIDGKFYRHGVDYQHYYATAISRLTRSKSHRTVLELGGGFGGLGYFLLRDNPDLTYIDVDLPENMALTAYYLLNACPDKKIALYGEVDLKTADLSQYDAIVLPNFAIAELPSGTVDLCFNSYSLAEMSLDTVDNYIAHFNRLATKYIYHINHTRIPPVKADEFPIDYSKFELVSRAPAMWNMGRNKEMDEFEYIYKAKDLSYA
ncbi:putative sugar O-methyltransferase [Pseudoduganella sp. FT55W]|uniref:Sugar O-methyltransferase n=1 Tax=Duganella rivi TaxID=2666083 RepID=A0A7X4KEH2_9BURK|nr:putative sugar O-methyltransferase [Duganella rivi]MYM70404.1 putative sugar O-methyltransferase [Duganella rivi]